MKIRYFALTSVLTIAILCFAVLDLFIAKDALAVDCLSASYTAQQKISCIQDLIAQLLLQVQSLQAQQSVNQAWCHTFNQNLGYANSGLSEVGQLHTALDKEGISYSFDAGDVYGKSTMNAVVRFQQKHSITPSSGYVGISTRAKLNSLYGCVATNSACTSSWQCSWGDCKNGYQSQVAVDSNNCGFPASSANIVCPALARACNVQPTFTVSSPNGGETWQVKNKYIVTWQTSGDISGKYIKIFLSDGPTPGDIGVVPANKNFFSWEISDTIISGNNVYQLEPGNYKIKVVLYDGYPCSAMQYGCVLPNIVIQDASDNYFTIVAAQPACASEGQSIPVIANPPSCCPGLSLIGPKAANVAGISGYCTAKCGNRVCDSNIETSYNCPQDCFCAVDGQKVYGDAVFGSTQCCNKNAGIKSSCISAGDKLCACSNDGSLGTCVDNWWQTCGDGMCGKGEDYCNCLEDCPML